MFNWSQFSIAAQTCADSIRKKDQSLFVILSASRPISERTDEMGKPIPDSVGIHQHPDFANYKRIISIRRSIAKKSGVNSYVNYANRILEFLHAMNVKDTLYLVQIVTKIGHYEFLFCPREQTITVNEVSQLRQTGEEHDNQK